jgi:uncharacterized membrane protein YdbT with pleckstrin-like domain
MHDYVHSTCKWCYGGIWQILTDWFRVPQHPPTLPASDPTRVTTFKPSDNYLRYLKLFFWIACVAIDVVLAGVWLAIALANPLIGALITPLMLLIMIAPDVVSYVAIHLKFDTTWYVVSDRSLRIRRGIWIIHETTITFENIQNVRLSQGPLERYFGFANLIVETAGGGSSSNEANSTAGAHQGIIAGVANAEQLRDQIMRHIQANRTAGLGDERVESTRSTVNGVLGSMDLRLLAEIRDQTALMCEPHR